MGPDFLCIGLQKAGTRWLFDQLRETSGVWMPPIKEINYFQKQSFKPGNIQQLKSFRKRYLNFGSPSRSLDLKFYKAFERGLAPEHYDDNWYFSLFAHKGALLTGDISPGYSRANDKQVAQAAQLLPNTRIILLLRHPVERAKSGISMAIRHGKIQEEDIQSVDGIKKVLSLKRISRLSYPSEVWQRWVKYFGAERCRFFFMEDISHKPETVRSEIADFIGLENPEFRLPADFNRKSNNKKFHFPAASEQFMSEFFQDEIRRCSELFRGHAERWAGNS